MQTAQSEAERLRQEVEAFRQERENFVDQVNALTQERERLAAPAKEFADSHPEAEKRFQAAVTRFESLLEEIHSLRQKFPQDLQNHYERGGIWRWLWSHTPSQPEPWQEALFQRLESLRKEATAAQKRAMDASADALRADYERQLAKARRCLQEAAERADHLEAELRAHQERNSPPSPPNPSCPEAEEISPSEAGSQTEVRAYF